MLTRLKRCVNFSVMALLILSISGCVTIYNPATGRNETFFIDTESEVSLGQDMDKELHKKLKIKSDLFMQSRLEAIGAKVAAGSDRQDLKYHFAIVDDKELNAFAIPGGYVYVNSGLVSTANNDELAGVLGHEIGHIAARHSVKRLQNVMGYQILMSIVLGSSGKTNMSQALDVVFNLVNLGYSRQDEYLADKLAVKYVRKSGYSPIGIITFFSKLEAEAKKRGSGLNLVFLSSHPPTAERIARVEEEIKLR